MLGRVDQSPFRAEELARMNVSHEKRLLQVAVSVLALVPISAGLSGMIAGPDLLPDAVGASRDLDSHYRYLSGLLAGIGLMYWKTVPNIEREQVIFRTLTLIVIIGGLGRLYALVVTGVPTAVMAGALVMELVVTPSLALWRERVQRRTLQ